MDTTDGDCFGSKQCISFGGRFSCSAQDCDRLLFNLVFECFSKGHWHRYFVSTFRLWEKIFFHPRPPVFWDCFEIWRCHRVGRYPQTILAGFPHESCKPWWPQMVFWSVRQFQKEIGLQRGRREINVRHWNPATLLQWAWIQMFST